MSLSRITHHSHTFTRFEIYHHKVYFINLLLVFIVIFKLSFHKIIYCELQSVIKGSHVFFYGFC